MSASVMKIVVLCEISVERVNVCHCLLAFLFQLDGHSSKVGEEGGSFGDDRVV